MPALFLELFLVTGDFLDTDSPPALKSVRPLSCCGNRVSPSPSSDTFYITKTLFFLLIWKIKISIRKEKALCVIHNE
jgi:hypothetical protein